MGWSSKRREKIPNGYIILKSIKYYWIRFYSLINSDKETRFTDDIKLIQLEELDKVLELILYNLSLQALFLIPWDNRSTRTIMLLFYLNTPPKLGPYLSQKLLRTEFMTILIILHVYWNKTFAFPYLVAIKLQDRILLFPRPLSAAYYSELPLSSFSALYYLYFSGYICTLLPKLLAILVCLSLTHMDNRQLRSNLSCRAES